ncbi:MAG: Gfo/Idh/MocA family oxidoreductase [Chlorobi bacterium]|nr:Gfo/Idh/MocA family oxidoreductase [Chlorobiota bacterium]
MRKIKFGIIGLGLMGREFASAAARWMHLTSMDMAPEIVAICDRSEDAFSWYIDNIPTIKQVVTDYREMLANKDVEAVYCAVPHHLHEEIYTAVIRAGKHLLGEKPFGIDKKANENILKVASEHPEVKVRCSSEFPFYPAAQKIGQLIEKDDFGKIIEVNAGFMHSSDMNPEKPINWKRDVRFNGEYGCMGDLGMHVCHMPFKAGWKIHNVRAVLSNLIPERPDNKGNVVVCETWDNATLMCEASDKNGSFPMTLKTQRIAPGQKNTWYIEILGTKRSVRFSTKNPKRLEEMVYAGGEQKWMIVDVGYEPAFSSITGGIFEFGFTDSILQMWAAYLFEIQKGKPLSTFAGCVTLEETAMSHELFTAALKSNSTKTVSEIYNI